MRLKKVQLLKIKLNTKMRPVFKNENLLDAEK